VTGTVRLRDPEEIKKRVTGNIRELNKRLLEVSIQVDAHARAHAIARTPQGRILTSFFREGVNTAKAIEVLKRERLIEEAWILLRVLLETQVNFFYFLQHDATEMSRRYGEAAILDKLKHLREVTFYEGTPFAHMHSRDQWEATEAAIQARHTPAEVKKMRRHGFTGLSFEDRAKAVGLKTMYEACYRIASRSVHMFDPAETSITDHYAFRGRDDERKDFLRIRRDQLESNQNMLLGRMAFAMSEIVRDGVASAELVLLGLGYEKHRDRESGPQQTAEDDDQAHEGTFRVWRE
jgi:hypothetical protein